MKKALILLMVLLMALQGMAACAEAAVQTETAVEPQAEAEVTTEAEAESEPTEEPEAPIQITYDYDELTVGTVTPFEGSFFTGMWGNMTSDLDVRLLLHAYNLVEWRGEDGVFAVDPSVVSGIIVTENAAGDRTYTLTLYNDLYYNDGTQITARDYAFSLLLSIAPEMGEIGGSIKPAQYIVGYEDYVTGAADTLSGVRILGEDTLAITVSNEYLPFFYELALLDCVPYPIHVIAPGCRVEDDGTGVAIVNEDETVEAPLFTADLLRQTVLDPETGYLSHPTVSCGPYSLVSFDGTTVKLALNERYKGNSHGLLPRIPRLVYTVVDNETMLQRFEAGEIGLLNKVLSADVLDQATRLTAASDVFTSSNYTRNGMSFISFCCEQEPVNSAAVRQAIAMCLDKDGMVADTVNNYGMRVDGYYGMGQWMVTLVNGNGPYPVDEPAADAPQADHDAYDAAVEEWQALSLDNARVYALDVEAAAALLDSEGWSLNRNGEPFTPGTDDVRCKDVDGELKTLELKLVCPVGSTLNAGIQANFVDHLAQAGVLLTVEEVPMPELQLRYYRRQDRDCDMFMLATNFDLVFDPSITFMPDGETVNHYNPTGIADEALYQRAVDMRQTSADDVMGYCAKWIAFEERFQELEPVIPIYSNVYFDFYPRVLHRYDIASNVAWSQAIVGAYMSDVPDPADVEEETEGDGIEMIDENGEMVVFDD